ncbi:MAG: MFS transporter [Clostridia bacterium]|nr:MFS transporter [Clostridia bacterium]
MAYLLVVIFIAFISLGVPDSLIGSAWPSVYTELNLPVEAVSCITLLISGSTVVSSFLSAGVLNRFGTAKVTAFSTALTAAALLGFSFAPNFWCMLPLAVALGLGAGAIDAGLNNFVALHFKASHMNFLHCFYGVGVSLSPYLMSVALGNSGWRNGYRYAFYIQTAIALLLIFSIPLWKKAVSAENGEETAPSNTSVFRLAKNSAVRKIWLIMLATNALEYACGTWANTYMVTARNFSPESGALGLTVYYAGMAMGRFVSGLISSKIKTWKRIWIGCGIVAAAVAVMLFPIPNGCFVAGLCLIGFGNGAIYPNLIHLTPHNFGKDLSQAIMGSQIAFAYIGVMIAPPLVSLICRIGGMNIYPVILAALTVIMVITTVIFSAQLKKQGKYHPEI